MELQANLAQARVTWTQHAQSWNFLTFQQKQEFVYDVLSLYLGEQVAANTVGLNAGGGGGSQGSNQGAPSASGGYHVTPEYTGEGCWAAAGCVEQNPDDGSYTYEEYDPGTDSYEPH